MSRQLQRKLDKRMKKSDKKLRLTPGKTGLTPLELTQLDRLTKNAEKFFNLDQFGSAEKLCRLILNVYPKHADAYHMLGRIAVHYNKHEKAIEFYEKSLNIVPDNSALLNNYAVALKYVNRTGDALKCFNRSLQLKSDSAETLNNKGGILKILGQIPEATECFEKAIELNPKFGMAFYNIAYLHKFKEGDRYAKWLDKIEPELGSLSQIDQMNFHFAYGKYYEDTKKYEKGFEHYLQANKIKKSTIDFKFEDYQQHIELLKSIFPKGGEWSTQTDTGCSSEVPIFVLGMPRSGTTLVEQILASHPKVFGAGELKLMSTVIENLNFGKDTFFPKDPEKRKKFDEDIKNRGERYVEKLREYCSTTDHVTDKMPQNFRYVGIIHLILPHAKIIHCKRNPVDTCLSNFRILFADEMDYTYDLEDLGKFYLGYHGIMEHWEEVLPGRMLNVQYEEVVGDIETQARRLIDHCGLEWDDACLDFHKTKRAVQTASVTQVRQPIYNSSVGQGARYGELLDPLLKVLEPIM